MQKLLPLSQIAGSNPSLLVLN